MSIALLAASLLFMQPASDASTSPQTTATVPASAAPVSADDSAVVCKSIAITGTRFPSRQCHTKGEWAAMTAAARDMVDKSTTGHCAGASCH